MRVPKKRSSTAVVYPETDDMGESAESALHRLIAELLRPLLARFFAERNVVANVGSNQFIYWAHGHPTKRIAPDVYVLPGIEPGVAASSWKTWETGVVPSFVLEVASDDFTKDYEDSPALYDELGVKELIIYDPLARPGSRSRRVRWQVYRRIRGRGLVRVDVSQSDRVRSKHLGAWLRAVGSGEARSPSAPSSPSQRRSDGCSTLSTSRKRTPRPAPPADSPPLEARAPPAHGTALSKS